jgi:hypothetical protein
MSNFVRIIPNSLWEELEGKGLLSSLINGDISSKKEILLSQIAQSLHDSAESILSKNKNLKWNDKLEIFNKSGALVPKSNLASLLTKFIIKSKTFRYLHGSGEFLNLIGQSDKTEQVDKVITNNKNKKWISFDSKFKSFIDKKHGPRQKIRSPKVLQPKAPRELPWAGWIS